MTKLTRSILAGAATFAILAGTAVAQTQDGQSATESQSQATPPLPEDAAPTPTEPAETETPENPAAAGGEASDATESGGPLSSQESDTTGSDTGGADAEATGTSDDAAAENGEAATDGSPVNPRNAVGDKFELPRVSEENQVNLIAGLCGINLGGLGQEGCTCLAEQAMEDLSAPQRDYLIAAGMAPPVAERMLKDGRIDTSDEVTIKTFLDTTYKTCMPAGAQDQTGTAPDASPMPSQPAPGATGGEPEGAASQSGSSGSSN